MARIGENAFRQYRDGQDRLTAREYMAEREQIRLAINDTEDKVERVESIREEFSNTVNDVIQTKQDIQANIGEFAQTIDHVNETISTLATKPELNSVSALLTDTVSHKPNWINVKEMGAIGDGVADDTNALQAIINSYDHIFFPNGVYYFSKLSITSSRKKLVFAENVTLKSDMNTNDARMGYIDVRGTPENQKYPIQQNIELLSNYLFVSTAAASQFSEGDIFEIEQTRPYAAASSVTTEEEHRQQNAFAVLTVKSTDSTTGKIEVYEAIPHEFKLSDNPYITKFNAVRDIEIIGSTTQYDKMGRTGHGNFFNVSYAYNVKITGFNCYNGAGKAVETYKVNRFFISDITFSKPTSQASAKGEAIMINRSGYGIIEKCYIYDSRRGVDFTIAWNCIVRDCMAMYGRFTTHGLLSKYITFVNCIVYGRPKEDTSFYALTIGNVDYMYDEYITFENCYVYGGYYGAHATAKSKNVTFKNCHFYNNVMAVMCRDSENVIINDCAFNDCQIDIRLEHVISSKINNIVVYAKSYYTTGGGSIHISGNSKDIDINGANILKNRDSIMMLDSSFNPANFKITNSVSRNLKTGTFYLGNVKGIEINNCETSDQLRLSGRENVTVRNSKFPSWVYGSGNEPIKNFIIKDNIVTGLNGAQPPLRTNAAQNIYVEGNMFLLNI